MLNDLQYWLVTLVLREQCAPLHLDKSDCWGLAREACPGMNTKVEWQLHHDCLGHEFNEADVKPHQMHTYCHILCHYHHHLILPHSHCHHQPVLAYTTGSASAWCQYWWWSTLCSSCKWVPDGNGWFVCDLLQYPHSTLLFCTMDRRTTHPTDAGPLGNGSP